MADCVGRSAHVGDVMGRIEGVDGAFGEVMEAKRFVQELTKTSYGREMNGWSANGGGSDLFAPPARDNGMKVNVEEVPVPLFAVDENLRTVAWNERMELLSGYFAEEVMGKDPSSALRCSSGASVHELFRVALKRGAADAQDAVLVSKDGSSVLVQCAASRIAGKGPAVLMSVTELSPGCQPQTIEDRNGETVTTSAREKDVVQEESVRVTGVEGCREVAFQVLVCDSNETNRKIMKVMLERMGYNVNTANQGKDAISIFRMMCTALSSNQSCLDAILIDLELEHSLDGSRHDEAVDTEPCCDQCSGFKWYETVSAIRKIEREAGMGPTPILAVTSVEKDDLATMGEDMETGLKCGINAFIRKPVTSLSLKQALGEFSSGPAT